MKKIIYLLFLFCIKTSLYCQTKIIINDSHITIFSTIEDGYVYYHSKQKNKKKSEYIICRTPINDTFILPKFKYSNNVFAIICQDERILSYQSWKFDNNFRANEKNVQIENFNKTFEKRKFRWDFHRNLMLHDLIEGNGTILTYDLIDIHTVSVVKYNLKAQWKELIYLDKKNLEKYKKEYLQMNPLSWERMREIQIEKFKSRKIELEKK